MWFDQRSNNKTLKFLTKREKRRKEKESGSLTKRTESASVIGGKNRPITVFLRPSI